MKDNKLLASIILIITVMLVIVTLIFVTRETDIHLIMALTIILLTFLFINFLIFICIFVLTDHQKENDRKDK